MGNEYSGQELKDSIVVTELLNGKSVLVQTPYSLNEAEFVLLQQGQPATDKAATAILAGVIGYAFSLGPKIVLFFKGSQLPLDDQFTVGDLTTLILGLLIAGVVYFAGLILPSRKNDVMNKISKHFETEKPSPRIMVEKQ